MYEQLQKKIYPLSTAPEKMSSVKKTHEETVIYQIQILNYVIQYNLWIYVIYRVQLIEKRLIRQIQILSIYCLI
jgi:hypothetical protein